jgi:hypothetical protein
VYGKKNTNIFRINSEYPSDGFWWDSQLRITAAYPPGPHFMEQYAHAVAELDACRITRGGLFLDKAHSEEIEKFAQAYRVLPAEKFETIGRSTDPVAVRTLVKEGVRYLYLVNREYFPIDVELDIDPSTQLTKLTLEPYELKSFLLKPDIVVKGFDVFPPKEVVQALTRDAENALAEIVKIKEMRYYIAGLDEIEKGIKSALNEKRWSWLRHALTGYHICKCRSVLGS